VASSLLIPEQRLDLSFKGAARLIFAMLFTVPRNAGKRRKISRENPKKPANVKRKGPKKGNAAEEFPDQTL
jgi:hypothetical protein